MPSFLLKSAAFLDQYWRERMSQRMDRESEIIRLSYVLKSFYYSPEWSGNQEEYKTLLDFACCGKRPYGNKSKAESIGIKIGYYARN